MPALAALAAGGKVADGFSVVGVARRPKTDDQFRAELREAMPQSLHAAFGELAPRVGYQSADIGVAEDIAALGNRLRTLPGGDDADRLFYLALAPSLFAPTVESLCTAGLVRAEPGDRTSRRVVIEKPFGHDLDSAQRLNHELHRLLDERQIYRIDHYLGKETVQNLIGFRFHNAIFEPLWNRHHVELVQITVAESIGVERGRAGYYDATGAVRDVLQNHMLQVLSLVAMEPPSSLSPEAIRDQKVSVLRGLHMPDLADVLRNSVRARYAAGEIDGKPVVGYTEEEGVASDSTTETYAAIRAEIDTWRWAGVPFLLRHGKRLCKKVTEIKVQFRTPPLSLFNRPESISDSDYRRLLRDGLLCQVRPNVLTLTIQPQETIRLSFGVKQPGPAMVMQPAELDFDYRERFHQESAPAYERLLLDALNGDPTLFLRADEIEASWRWTDQLLTGWERENTPLQEYPAGSWGPPSADELFYGCEGGWSVG